VNLGNPSNTSIAELAALVIELTGSKSKVERRPLPQDDPKRRMPDIAIARDVLGWDPLVPLRVGLERTIEFFASRTH
jgi:UDP-glucuronate decarboxylase